MRFKKGGKVEVLDKKEVLSRSWRCGEIIAGNGHNYSVRYDNFSGLTSEGVVERVSRKAIRPCPPLVEGVDGWMAGDVIEVFDDICWKTATVLEVMDMNFFLVRVLGSCQDFIVHKSNIRTRQSWDDGKWVVIGKGSGRSSIVKSTSNCSQRIRLHEWQADMVMQARDDCLAVHSKADFQNTHAVTRRMLKRASPYCSSHVEIYTRKSQKIRAIENEDGRCERVGPALQMGKVDAVAYPQDLGKKYMHASFDNQTTGGYEFERRQPNRVVERSLAENLESSDSNGDASSVGSCSTTSNCPNELSRCFSVGLSRDMDTLCSDAESFHHPGGEEEKFSLPSKQELAAGIHRLELHAYRCTLEALYALGPLSWERETLLTNLRFSLNISSDEHLMELRNLISTGTSLHNS